MRDRLFDGFTTADLVGLFRAASAAADALDACGAGDANFTVMGPGQDLHLRAEGITVIIGHRDGEELKVTVHHNIAYPEAKPLTNCVAELLDAEKEEM
jgi:hypothetical protein